MPDDGEAFLRVGGKLGYASQAGKLPGHLQDGDQLILPHEIDLDGAERAEVTLEKVQSHEDSKDLRIAINGHAPIPVGEPDWIPEPQTEYMYHTDLTLPIPLDQLHPGKGNRFALTLDTSQRWGWPQNVFYAIIFRVYYPSDSPAPELSRLPTEIPAKTYLSIDQPGRGARSADYIFVGTDTDWSGRGTLNRKHWQTFRGRAHHTLGHSTNPAERFAVAWDTEWLPDQDKLGVQARVQGEDGKYRVSKVSDGLRFPPPVPGSRLRIRPRPRNWVTRSGEFEQTVEVGNEVSDADAIQLNWVSWSPCYANGVYLNGHLVWNTNEQDECYVWATHEPVYTGLEVKFLQPGENVLSTGLTPLFRGQMVHGMEVQWPGVQLKVRYGVGEVEEH